jgi:hypothetical protein
MVPLPASVATPTSPKRSLAARRPEDERDGRTGGGADVRLCLECSSAATRGRCSPSPPLVIQDDGLRGLTRGYVGNPRWRRAPDAPSIGAMAKYELHEDAARVSIEVSGVDGERQERELLEAFDECRGGRCTCPTDQYDKLASMQVEHGDSAITLKLEPKPGARFDTTELQTCLEHTIGKARGSQ